MMLQLAAALILSAWSQADFPLTADPDSAAWKGVAGVFAGDTQMGVPVPGHRTEIRSRWTKGNLYLLFVCPYESLNLKPGPVLDAETNRLWNWDVAETFIGSDMVNIHRYKEFQVSPRGEYVDLDIDRKQPLPGGGVSWNSGFQVKARIDEERKIWYGEMQIPFAALGVDGPEEGRELRINFFRMQGPDRKMLAWQPTNSKTYHVPEAFGMLRLQGGR